MVPTPHDALFKAVFAEPSRALGVVRAVLPAEVSRQLDLDSARLEPGSFVDEALRPSHADLLFRVRLAGRDAFLYLLFEHQSERDRLMPFRLLRYMVRLWDRWLVENPCAAQLPAIVPLLLCHAPGGWQAPVRMREMYDLSRSERQALGPWLPDFRMALDDLREVDDAQLRVRVLDAVGRLALLLFKHARTAPELVRDLVSWADLVREVTGAPGGPAALQILLRYAVQVGQVEPRELAGALEAAAGPEAAEAAMTAGERLIEEGRQQGLKQGMQQGMQQGIQQGMQQGIQQGMQQGMQQGLKQGMQKTLLRLLARRFGELAPAVTERVEAASTEQLELWSDRVLTAGSLDAVFGD